ncbi:hypothetical protein P153DRAFT_173520 [Dothidotthia symphoricarpi CBS 119687]|uniref:Transcription factor domain-containing protein n=1 Tax=Dothidotthia symphoricarpi CBS 119687 TaxID=1392245 RepID=A0A6A6ANL1_9PLEO|nr:uncharacterized protein P153DRAFT_173520 [Dothidotthia symphoricarpi CBS 119687]KAF2132783.1 hypothetical protein P153DRAFT_173520 [Dothidotthia symphoricarpi CBS 119687]
MESHGETAKTRQHSQPTVPVRQDFLFVDAAQARTSRQGRRNARSFVMQKARRERPWSTSKHTAKQRNAAEDASPMSATTSDSLLTPINTATPSPPIFLGRRDHVSSAEQNHYTAANQKICQHCNIFLCRPGQRSCPRCLLLESAVPTQDPDNSLFDPFRTSSVETNKSVSELLEHFVTQMAPGIIAIDVRHQSTLMRRDWYGTAMSNSGFMHSLLCTAALHLYIVGKGSINTILYHRALAVASINAAISSLDHSIGISDANIGAVFNMMVVEESLLQPFFEGAGLDEEQPYQRAIHMDGLQRMVQLRGGLMGLYSNRILQAFILWHSTAHAIATLEAPNMPTLDYISSACFPHHPLGYSPSFSQHLLNYCRHAGVRESLTSLVESVLILIADLNVWFSDPECPLDPLDIQNFSCVLECSLLRWLNDNASLITPLEDALCIALLIFVVRTTEAMKRHSDVHLLHFTASKRLVKSLNCTIRSEWQFCPDILLWILAIGSISADGSPESPWFVYQTSLATAEFGIQSVGELLARLHLCGWVSYKLNDAVCRLWDRIVNLRLEPYLTASSVGEDPVSPVGPLQSHVADLDLVDWQNMDWRAFDPQQGDANQYAISGTLGVGGAGFVAEHRI